MYLPTVHTYLSSILCQSITYKNILSQDNLDTIKRQHLVQALVLVFKGYPNYISNMFSIKDCGSRPNQPTPNTSFKHKSFFYVACQHWNNLPSHIREALNFKNFIAKLKELKLGLDVCHCNICASYQ